MHCKFEVVREDARKYPELHASGEIEKYKPRRATKQAIGHDVCILEDYLLMPKEAKLFPIDYKIVCPDNVAALMNPRSGLHKRKIALANTQGWIDPDYANNEDNDGNIGAILYNYGDEPVQLLKGERVAQIGLFMFAVADDDAEIAERKGGLGSTGGHGNV